MEFKCRHRKSDGSIVTSFIDVPSRKEAFQYARARRWNVVEMIKKDSIREECKKYKNVKIPNQDELKLLIVRRDSFLIGFWSNFLPFIGWILACCFVYNRHDMRGLKCCLYGSFLPVLWLTIFSLIEGITIFVIPDIVSDYSNWIKLISRYAFQFLAISFPTYLFAKVYKKDILLGYTIPKTSYNKDL